MDCFLNFKNKRLETKYYESIDPYLNNIITSNLVVAAVGLPITPYTQYLRFKTSTAPLSVGIRRAVLGAALYILLILIAYIIKKMRPVMRRHQRLVRWIFDIFFNCIAGYLSYMYWDSAQYETDPTIRYYWGWWNSLISVALLSPISRWYMKLMAYLILILRIGIASYIAKDNSVSILINMFQMALLQMLLTYFGERDRRKEYIEKQALYEETRVFKEIFDETADGVIIYGLKEEKLFRNWTNDKYRWWNNQLSLQENFQKLILKGYKKTAQLSFDIDCDLDSVVHSTSQPNLWVFLDRLACDLRSQLSQDRTQKLQSENLMILTGHIQQGSADDYLLEIKIMFTTFRETPALALIFSDITERNMVTVLQENNNYKNRLLASVSHELRTPLNASINFTVAAIEHPDLVSSDVKENYLMPALRSNQLLLHLINDILDFSQMSANKLRLVYENNNVVNTLEECVNLVKIQATRKGLKLTSEYELEREMNEFCTDHNRLKQIVLNLLSNALKFTLKGEIKLSMKTFSTNDPKMKRLSITVSDTGIGISNENKIKLFKAFEKIELGDRISLNTQGVGLGLVISNNLVLMLGPPDQSNGMKVESELNKGTSFSFWIIEQTENPEIRLPSRGPEDNDTQMDEFPDDRERIETIRLLTPKIILDTTLRSPQITTVHGKTQETCEGLISTPSKYPRILVVDDDIFNIAALEMILRKLGYSCDIAYNGEQAIEKVLERHSECERVNSNQTQYKLIFMDWSMPIMDGFEASKILKKKMELSIIDEIRIVACTAYLNEKEKQRANEIGVDGYCIKPLSKDKVCDAVKKFIPRNSC